MNGLLPCLALSVGLVACGGGGSSSGDGGDAALDSPSDAVQGIDRPHADSGDAQDGQDRQDGQDGRDAQATPDVSLDRFDAPSDRTNGDADARDGAGGAAVDSGTGGAAGSGVGGNPGTGGAGVGGSGSGGSTGGTTGTGGNDGGSDGTDAGADVAADAPGAPDAAVDSAAIPDGGTDAPTVGCGSGCPATIQPQSLVLWVSADVGVTCDQSTPPRVTGWQDRRAGSSLTIAPGIGKLGPRCDGQTLSGHPLPFFDRTTTDVDNGVLPVDLTPLDGSSYTVFVVERRRAADARYILGTDVPSPAALALGCVNDNAHATYRFGYRSPILFGAGSYTYNVDTEDCIDPAVIVPAFTTAQAALEIDRLAMGGAHSVTVAALAPAVGDDVDPMDALLQGYLGRAFQGAGGDSRYLGEIAEVVIYRVALGVADVTAVSDYLKARWGL